MKVSIQQMIKSVGIIGCMLLLSVVLGAVSTYGYLDLSQQGLLYFHQNSDSYVLSHQNDSNKYTTEINLNDLDENIGKRIFDNGEQYIEITQLDYVGAHAGGYRIFFRSHGTYHLNGGKLISGVMHSKNDTDALTLNCQAVLNTSYSGVSYQGKLQGITGYLTDGDIFGFYLFPTEAYENGEISLENAGKATITLTQLTEHTWTRIQ